MYDATSGPDSSRMNADGTADPIEEWYAVLRRSEEGEMPTTLPKRLHASQPQDRHIARQLATCEAKRPLYVILAGFTLERRMARSCNSGLIVAALGRCAGPIWPAAARG